MQVTEKETINFNLNSKIAFQVIISKANVAPPFPRDPCKMN